MAGMPGSDPQLSIVPPRLGEGLLELIGNTPLLRIRLFEDELPDVHVFAKANVSAERRALVHAYGAEVTFSDPMEGSDGAIRLCREVLAADPDLYYMPDQYNNPENWRAHYHGTGPEIWEQTRGSVTHFVAALGTGGPSWAPGGGSVR
jgi:cysteine synthase B